VDLAALSESLFLCEEVLRGLRDWIVVA
jgi:hypothetical protein